MTTPEPQSPTPDENATDPKPKGGIDPPPPDLAPTSNPPSTTQFPLPPAPASPPGDAS
ncbi:MAG: hypothetical protein ACTHU0_21235 [Kofleriaceae bacterium]